MVYKKMCYISQKSQIIICHIANENGLRCVPKHEVQHEAIKIISKYGWFRAYRMLFSRFTERSGVNMVDDLTRQGVSTLKALSEVSVELIKMLAALLNRMSNQIENGKDSTAKLEAANDFQEKANKLLKGELPPGEFAKEVKDAEVMKIPDSAVADMFEAELRFNGFDYSKMSDSNFVVRGSDMGVLNKVLQDTAQEINSMKDQPIEEIQKQAKDRLNLAKEGKSKDQVEKITKTKAKVKETVKHFKQKAEKKDHNRERQKQKTKNKEADR